MSFKYYYFRDEQNKPRTTVCLVKIGDRIARGIAICSMLDNPCKQTGRNIAKGRALKAMFTEKSSDNINRKTIKGIIDIRKSVYNPILTDFECDLLAPPPKEYIQQKISFEIDCKIRMQSL